jgi:diaminopimelate decarboxylase
LTFYIEQSNKIKNFAIVDAAMNDLIRPSLYDAHHKLIPLYEDLEDENEVEQKTWDVVGPICETGDFLAKNRTLNLQEGDTLGSTDSRPPNPYNKTVNYNNILCTVKMHNSLSFT